MRPDDCSLRINEYNKVRKEAERILAEADAFGRFPTPVSDILCTAKVEVALSTEIDDSFLFWIRKKAGDTGEILKRALNKVVGLFDAKSRLIFVDTKVLFVKQTFIKLHETGHAFLPWQKDIYGVIEDCSQTLSSDVSDQFDREANVFASEVLFQLDNFTKEATNFDFGIHVPIKLHKKYGASIYASIRRYVSENQKACVVLILDMPELKKDDGFIVSLRRVVSSESFNEKIGLINWQNTFTPNDRIGSMIPLGRQRMSGKQEISLTNSDGERYECIAEAFTQTYQIFVLIHLVQTLNKTTIILPSSYTLN